MDILPLMGQVMFYLIALVVLAIFVMGVGASYEEFRKWRWGKKYGERWRTLGEDAKRNSWIERRRIEEQVHLLEDHLQSQGDTEAIHKIQETARLKDYSSDYESWKKGESELNVLMLRSMSGTLPDGIHNMNDWKKYQEQLSSKPTGSRRG